MQADKKSTRFLRKAAVALRYGGVSKRWVDRAVAAGKIPAPVYPAGPKTPMWDEAVLDEHDRAVVRASAAA